LLFKNVMPRILLLFKNVMPRIMLLFDFEFQNEFQNKYITM
jgi:hypothetical protein